MNQDIVNKLEEKAVEIQNYLISLNLQSSYKLISYGINFSILQADRYVVLTVSYSPKKDHWIAHSNDTWAANVMKPNIERLLNQGAIESGSAFSPPKKSEPYNTSTLDMSSYFTEARQCLTILEPFAQEFLDFSIIFEYAQKGVQRVLLEIEHQHIDKNALLTLLEQPRAIDFIPAKEYLSQCLKLCHIPMSR